MTIVTDRLALRKHHTCIPLCLVTVTVQGILWLSYLWVSLKFVSFSSCSSCFFRLFHSSTHGCFLLTEVEQVPPISQRLYELP